MHKQTTKYIHWPQTSHDNQVLQQQQWFFYSDYSSLYLKTPQNCSPSDGKGKKSNVGILGSLTSSSRPSVYLSITVENSGIVQRMWLHAKRGAEKEKGKKERRGEGRSMREKSATQRGRTYGSHSSLRQAPASRAAWSQGIGRTPLVPSAHYPLLLYKPWCAITFWSSLLFCAWNPQSHTFPPHAQSFSVHKHKTAQKT